MANNNPNDLLQYQEFNLGAAAPVAGTMGSNNYEPNMGTGPSTMQQPMLPLPATSAPASQAALWQIEYYRPYFNVDSDQVLKRIMNAWLPYVSFFDTVGDNPDLYGPVWIATTVVFLMFVTGSIAQSVADYANGKTRSYDFTKLSLAATVVYSYAFIAPCLLYGLFRWWHVEGVQLVALICLYGYALAILVPVSLISIVPLSLVRWVVIAVAYGLSATLLARSMVPLLRRSNARADKQTLTLIVMLALHGALMLLFKFEFFNYEIEGVTTPSATNSTLTI